MTIADGDIGTAEGQMGMQKCSAAILLLALLVTRARADAPFSGICGDVVGRGVVAYLTSNLDCSAFSGPAVVLGANASLELRGFQVLGNHAADPADGVVCSAGCTVVGPGTVEGFSRDGISSPGHLSVRNTNVRGNGRDGTWSATATIRDSTITDNVHWGVTTSSAATILGSSVTGNALGVISDSRNVAPGTLRGVVTVADSDISGNEVGIFSAARVAMRNSTVDGNTFTGVVGRMITVDSSRIRDNGFTGIDAFGNPGPTTVHVVDSEITGNGSDGISAFAYDFRRKPSGTVALNRTIITNNGRAGVDAFKLLVGPGTLVNGNSDDGVAATRVSVRLATISGNGGSGIRARNWSDYNDVEYRAVIRLNEAEVSGNSLHGVDSERKAIAKGSQVSGNRLSPDCESLQVCADFRTSLRPKLNTTSCETSYSTSENTDWGVCTLDPP